jgi:steroid delta-isomerase-like uncharacterized protein
LIDFVTGALDMSDSQTRAVLRQWVQSFSAEGVDDMPALMAPNYRAHQAGFPAPMDRAQHEQFGRAFLRAFPDAQVAVEDLIVEGDTGVIRWTLHGTHRGEMMGIPATGKAISIGGIEINRVENGQIVEHWVEMDQLGMLQQLGVIPPQG